MEVVDTVLHWSRAVLGSLLSFTGFAAEAPAVTFHKHIAPILLEYCAPCHRPGESGPFPLLTYEDARKRAGQIATVTRRRYMPPWLPEAGTQKFAGERRLTESQIELIGKWAAAGAPEGDARDARPFRTFTPGWQLGTPDLIVEALKAVPDSGRWSGCLLEFRFDPAGWHHPLRQGNRDSAREYAGRTSRESAD